MTKTNRMRVKVTLACIPCRQKKVKCDGVQPSCSRCGNKTRCQYLQPKKKRGPVKTEGERIVNRFHRMESLIQNQLTCSELNCIEGVPINTLYWLITQAVEQKKTYGSNDTVFLNDPFLPDIWSAYFSSHFNLLFPLLPDQFCTEDPLLNLAVFSLGALYSASNCHLVLFEKAEQILKVSFGYTVSIVQALVILSWYCHLIGDVQKCDAFRRQLSHAIDWHLSGPLEDTNTYWIAWVIDQWISHCTSRERTICQRDLPWPASPSFHPLIRLTLLLDSPHESALTAWLIDLPVCLDYTALPTPINAFYRVLYHTAQMIIHQRHQHTSSHSTCMTAANTIVYLMHQLSHTQLAYNALFLSLTLATSYLHSHAVWKPVLWLYQANCTLLDGNEFNLLLQSYLSQSTMNESRMLPC